MKTDTSEKGLEALIVADMTGRRIEDFGAPAGGGFSEEPEPFVGLHNWLLGDPKAYDRAWTVDLVQLRAFVAATQPALLAALDLDNDSPTRQKFLARLQGEIGKRGVIDVLRHGRQARPARCRSVLRHAVAGQRQGRRALRAEPLLRHPPASLQPGRHRATRSISALFINGLPVATFELKNSLTKQTVEDAVEQYKRDRDPREKLFEFGRCMVHFAVDDAQAMFCTHLKGKASWFLPFNKGWNDGAGNPPNPGGLKTDYLWKRHPDAARPDGHHRELRPDR